MKNRVLELIVIVSCILSGCAGVQPNKEPREGTSNLEIQMIETMRDASAPTNYGL